MVEKFNVEVKTILNRVHSVLAVFFWLAVGIIIGKKFDNNWSPLIGIVVGVIRLFIINDRFSWQIATLEEIQETKSLAREVLEYQYKLEIEKVAANSPYAHVAPITEAVVPITESVVNEYHASAKEPSDDEKKKAVAEYVQTMMTKDSFEKIYKMQDAYFNTSNLAFMKNLVPDAHLFVDVADYKKKLQSLI